LERNGFDNAAPHRFQLIVALKNKNNIRRPSDNEDWQKQTWHRIAFATLATLYYKHTGCSVKKAKR